jgi:hypothetical protein
MEHPGIGGIRVRLVCGATLPCWGFWARVPASRPTTDVTHDCTTPGSSAWRPEGRAPTTDGKRSSEVIFILLTVATPGWRSGSADEPRAASRVPAGRRLHLTISLRFNYHLCWRISGRSLLPLNKKKKKKKTLPRGPRPTYFMQVEGLGMSSASALLRALDSYRPKTPPDKGKFFADCRTMGIPPGDRVLAWALYHNSDPLPPPLMRTSTWRPPRATESVPLPPPPSPGGGTASD